MYAKMVIRLIISRFVVPLYCKNVKLLYNVCKMFLQFGVIGITRNMVLLILLILSACLASLIVIPLYCSKMTSVHIK